MIKDKRNFVIQLLALLGLILSIKLVLIFNAANYDKYALSSFCSINDFVDCDGVARTTFSQFAGIPLAFWGVFLYLTILFLSFVDKLKNIKLLSFLEVFKNPKSYITVFGTIAFICSMILAGISLGIIKKICILCVGTYVIDLIIALVASRASFKNIINDFKTTFFDFIDGVKKYTSAAIILALLFGGFISYSAITYNFVPNVKQARNINKYRKIKYNPYRVKGNILGNPKGDVVIELYSDYVCPLCYVNNIMLHQAAKEYKNILIIHHNYPLDKYCNHYLQIEIHPYACYMSRAALAAKRQNNYWEMSSLLYENQPKKLDKLLELVDKLGFNKEQFIKDFKSKEIRDELDEEIEQAVKLEIDATPTMYINGDKYVGVRAYFNMKKILEEHGAKK